jgi:hypothetical protein
MEEFRRLESARRAHLAQQRQAAAAAAAAAAAGLDRPSHHYIDG